MIHVWEGMSQPCFVVPCSLNFKDSQTVVVFCTENYYRVTLMPLLHCINQYTFICISFTEIHLIYLSNFEPIACPPVCEDAEFHHVVLGGLWRMRSLSGADVSSQRGCSSQERG